MVVVDRAASASLSRNNPWHERKLTGAVVATVLRGVPTVLELTTPGEASGVDKLNRRGDAILVLEDGRVFRGESYGATGETFGEAVFSTGMTGYQETLTDPSYHRQVVVMTSPHVGNTGMNDEDVESAPHLGERVRRPRPCPGPLQLALGPARSTTSCASRASSASAASTPAR